MAVWQAGVSRDGRRVRNRAGRLAVATVKMSNECWRVLADGKESECGAAGYEGQELIGE